MRYAPGAPPALHDVDLEVPAGRTVALVGATGSGKTTLAALLARLYDPTDGRVVVDGADLREVDVGSVRSAVAITGDDPFLFSTTVAENIAYACPEATRAQIQDAARRAQAHEFIESLPDGYDTRVGERVMAGRTTFIIAHRLSTIALADEIVVLEDGRVGDYGTHAQLLKRSPLYREIVEKGLPDSVFLTRKQREQQVAGL